MGKKKAPSKSPAKKTESKLNGKSSHGKSRNGNKRNGVVTAGPDDYQFRQSIEGMPCMLCRCEAS